MPNEKPIKMEDMSEAYLRALCAYNGYSIVKVEHDNDGLDIGVRCKGKADPSSSLCSSEFEVQLKSTYAKITIQEDGSVKYVLDAQNYNWLVNSNRMIPLILVVFHMHNDESLWLEQTQDWLKITKCAYWISLKGRPETNNTNTVTIEIPATNVLNKESLREIMVKVSKQETL